jgi:hypothetical protein
LTKHVVIPVQETWDEASPLPGRGDYREMQYVDMTGVGYRVTAWRHRTTGVLEMRNAVITAGPPAAASPE